MTDATRATPKTACRDLMLELKGLGFEVKISKEELIEGSQIKIAVWDPTKELGDACEVANWSVAEHVLRGVLLLSRIR